jgi:hypothetical protein
MSGRRNQIVAVDNYNYIVIGEDANYFAEVYSKTDDSWVRYENPIEIGGLFDKSDYMNGYGGEGANWSTSYTLSDFIRFAVEQSDLGYYQLKNKCKAIVKAQEPFRLLIQSVEYGWVHCDDGTSHFENWGGEIDIDPVLAQAIIDTYN